MHDLAVSDEDSVFGLVAATKELSGEILSTYRIEPDTPAGKSYAAVLSKRYGLEIDALRWERKHGARISLIRPIPAGGPLGRAYPSFMEPLIDHTAEGKVKTQPT